MRPIKFRCWHKEVRDGDIVLPGWMDYDPEWINITAHRELKEVVGAIGVDCIKHQKAKVNSIFLQGDLMQFTGLLDKNGKEIYEGDIIKCGSYNDDVIFEMQWVGMTGRDCHNGLGFDIPAENNEPGEWEVIGNIYENSELIKNEQ